MAVTAAAIPTAIRAAISPYSIAVQPSFKQKAVTAATIPTAKKADISP